MHLRYAAERIRVLHLLAGAVYKLAALQVAEDHAGSLHLSLMGTYGMDTGGKRLLTSVESFEGHCGYLVSDGRDMSGMNQGPYCVGQHELGTVEKGQTFL